MSGDGRVAQVTARAHVPTVTMHHYDVLLAAARLALGHNCALFAPFARDPTQDPPRAASPTVLNGRVATSETHKASSQHSKPTRRWTDVLRDEDAWDEVRAVDGDGSWWSVVRDWDAHARARYARRAAATERGYGAAIAGADDPVAALDCFWEFAHFVDNLPAVTEAAVAAVVGQVHAQARPAALAAATRCVWKLTEMSKVAEAAALAAGLPLCRNQPLVWVVLTKLQNSLARSNRS